MLDIIKSKVDSFVEINTKLGENIEGYVLSCNSDYLVIKDYYDFKFIGFKCVFYRSINSFSEKQPEEVFSKIVCDEHMNFVDGKYEYVKKTDSLSALVKEFYSRGEYIMLHLLDNSLSLGRLVSHEHDKGLRMVEINRNFEFDTSVSLHKEEELAYIEFGSEYIRTYSKYSR